MSANIFIFQSISFFENSSFVNTSDVIPYPRRMPGDAKNLLTPLVTNRFSYFFVSGTDEYILVSVNST